MLTQSVYEQFILDRFLRATISKSLNDARSIDPLSLWRKLEV
jgi:hypothetical protein